LKALLARDHLTQALAAVAHQHPAALAVDRQELGNTIGTLARENRNDRRLVRARRDVRLEPAVAALRRYSQHRRPGPHVWLADRAGRAQAGGAQLLVDPLVRLGKPAGIGPLRHAKTLGQPHTLPA